MKSVGIVAAAALLGICRQRVQQLIYADRVKGAYKNKQGWQIPLYNGMPRISRAKRGCKGTWRTREGKPKMIHVNSIVIRQNNQKVKEAKKAKKAPEGPYAPVLIVRQGSKTVYGHELEFEGKCRIVYDPTGSSICDGIKVWIEILSTLRVRVTDWNKQGRNQFWA